MRVELWTVRLEVCARVVGFLFEWQPLEPRSEELGRVISALRPGISISVRVRVHYSIIIT